MRSFAKACRRCGTLSRVFGTDEEAIPLRLIILFGPHAVGKMTVGQALSRKTGLRLFHNHMTIDLVSNFFDYGTPEGKRLVRLFREEIFEAVSQSELPGLIFTYMWAFDAPEDWAYVRHVSELFASHGAEVDYVELEADYDVRIERNKTENRLLNKPAKRDLAHSEALFRGVEAKYRLNSLPGELPFEKYLRIDNTRLSPDEAADLIAARFFP